MSNKIEVDRELLEDFLNHRDNGDWCDGVWVTHGDRLRALLAKSAVSLTDEGDKPADQRQGEPAAWELEVEGYKTVLIDNYQRALSEQEHFQGRGRTAVVHNLYRHPANQPTHFTAVDMTTAAAQGFRDGQAVPDALKAFANEMISASFEGGNFEGGDIQDIAVTHGLLRIEPRNEECGEVCACREYGFPVECYRKTDLITK